MNKIISILLRYYLAVLVAFVTSMSVLIGSFLAAAILGGIFNFNDIVIRQGLAGMVTQLIGFVLGLLLLVSVSFSGVLAGSLCLPRPNRRLGSVILGFLGVAFGITMSFMAFRATMDEPYEPIPLILIAPHIGIHAVLAVGAALASLLIWKRASGRGQDPVNIPESQLGKPEEAKRDPY